MSDSIAIDIGSVLTYLEEKLRMLFGRDSASRDAESLLERQTRLALRDAVAVQIIGMDRPVTITDIYQQMRLRKPWDDKDVALDHLISSSTSAVIRGRPGSGKTALLHYTFVKLSHSTAQLPVLFTLRYPNAVEDLIALVAHLAARRIKLRPQTQFILLVDGYDGASLEDRKRIDDALREYQSLGVGPFYLTCRSFYAIDEAGAEHFEIAPFQLSDATNFVAAFAKAYGTTLDAPAVIAELRARGFDDFASHPLMLALVCILKAGPLSNLPRSAMGLIRRAVDTLTFRWDESRSIARDSRFAIDGDDRVRCLMRIAYAMESYDVAHEFVQATVKEYLKLIQRTDISASAFLDELAQWYGILIPAGQERWMFAHRTIHDYLAARFWVESGAFQPERITRWDTRAAYAACLMPDATDAMRRTLQTSEDIAAFVECLYNSALFDARVVSAALVEHFGRYRTCSVEARGKVLHVNTERDFFAAATEDLLRELLLIGVRAPTTLVQQTLFSYAAAEYVERHGDLPADVRALTPDIYGRNRVLAVRRGDITKLVSL